MSDVKRDLDELVCSVDVCACSGEPDECACRPPRLLRSLHVCLDCCAVLEPMIDP